MAALPLGGAFVALVYAYDLYGAYYVYNKEKFDYVIDSVNSLVFVAAALIFAAIVILIKKNSLLFPIAALVLTGYSIEFLYADMSWIPQEEFVQSSIFCTSWLMLYGYLSLILDNEEAFDSRIIMK